ncbi:MAG: hypothetical protein ACM3XM_01900 [Mycobacterium leprae]
MRQEAAQTVHANGAPPGLWNHPVPLWGARAALQFIMLPHQAHGMVKRHHFKLLLVHIG